MRGPLTTANGTEADEGSFAYTRHGKLRSREVSWNVVLVSETFLECISRVQQGRMNSLNSNPNEALI